MFTEKESIQFQVSQWTDRFDTYVTEISTDEWFQA